MDEYDIKNLINNIHLDYQITSWNLKIHLKYRSDWNSNTIDTLYIPLHDLKEALNNLDSKE